MTRVAPLAAAFVVTLAAVTGGAAVAGYVTADGAAPAPAIQNDHYQNPDLIANDTPGQATVEMDASAGSQTVLVDPGVEPATARPVLPFSLIGLGGGGVADRDIRPLANALIENGHEVGVYVPDPDQQRRPARPGAEETTQLGERLAEADAFVTFRTDYEPDELDAIESFVESGGHVVLATEPDAAYSQPGAASLDATLDVTTEGGYVYNMEENDLNYQRVYAEATGDASLTEGVDRAVFPSATPVGTPAGGADVLRPIEGSELSTTRAPTDAPLLVRNDEVVMIGDSDFLSPDNARRADNDALIGNLADFLVTNDRTPPGDGGSTGPTQPGPGQPPTNGTAG
ncbi:MULTISPECIES: DUF4350 domain-containing protein [Halorubrum]|uniref:DUF4350 domain-containing protein n=1 Tax=Halorubrum ezzemoulense TaxID=337243 RepID=A0A256JTF1_HALEZ|nr:MULTISPECIES: DUF4350 domain-containing protein [Halorubrum]MDB2282182.1 hypothetical protein [Halorubrum ezzemoulense]MDB9253295.1 hypothetical protein [Halorubrum ezzemoulense]MDB9256340.1 hypothetical protein [Halorubrum ezzemoulense]MDB9277612.1 hypothetical protein [Halorubrum ezzemoulense]OYR67273.1 hypothetical protein DJ78_16560 [Halorubrum ezzemoulense]